MPSTHTSEDVSDLAEECETLLNETVGAGNWGMARADQGRTLAVWLTSVGGQRQELFLANGAEPYFADIEDRFILPFDTARTLILEAVAVRADA